MTDDLTKRTTLDDDYAAFAVGVKTPDDLRREQDELAMRRRRVIENVLRWAGSPLTIALAILVTIEAAGGIYVSSYAVHWSTSEGFARFSERVDYVLGIAVALLAVIAIWAITLCSRLPGPRRRIGFQMMRLIAVLLGVGYAFSSLGVVFVAFAALIDRSYSAFLPFMLAFGFIGLVIYLGVKYVVRLYGFLADLETVVRNRGYGRHPDPGSLPAFLFWIGGLSVFAAVLMSLMGRIEIFDNIPAVAFWTIIDIAFTGVIHIYGGVLLRKYVDDVSSVTVR